MSLPIKMSDIFEGEKSVYLTVCIPCSFISILLKNCFLVTIFNDFIVKSLCELSLNSC